MKNIITLAVSLLSLTLYAQVGINNNAPKATLDITAKTTDGSKPEGLIAPRLTGDQIQAGDAQYGTAQKGSIVYATAAATAPSTKTANITAEGYYFFDGSAWQKITGASAGDTTNDAWINDTTNAMVKLGTNADGTPRTAGTDFVVRDNGQVGIGTSSPSAKLEINSSSSGVLKLVDGTQGANKVLMSDANGLATWQDFNQSQNIGQVITGSFIIPNYGVSDPLQVVNTANAWKAIASVNLPSAGTYIVSSQYEIFLPTGAYFAHQLSDKNLNYLTTGGTSSDVIPGTYNYRRNGTGITVPTYVNANNLITITGPKTIYIVYKSDATSANMVSYDGDPWDGLPLYKNSFYAYKISN